VWAIRPLKKYAVFSGRAPRAEYWWYYLGTVIVSIPIGLFEKITGTSQVFSSMYQLALILPWLGVTVRRLHDIDRSAWWLLALVVPLGLVGIAVAAGTDNNITALAAAQLGSMAIVMIIVAVLSLIVAGITLLVFMVTRGTEGPNRYGPDPYGPDSLEEVFA
jgi:uncharacterized membrane protein YhaH (DUF805 family)